MTRVTVVIDSYQYAEYVGEAIAGTLGQTRPPDEVVVVDDGSTDGSRDVIRRAAADEPRIRFLEKENGGQLSAIQAGVAEATGDVVFFLDADDLYRETCLERVTAVYDAESETDFVFTAMEEFGARERVLRPFCGDRDLGYSVLATLMGSAWLGNPMSGISMRREVLDRFLPLPASLVPDWRQRADDCLILGASLAMARKRYVDEPLVRYRIHDRNHSSTREHPAYCDYTYRLRRRVLVGHLARRVGLDAATLSGEIVREYRTGDGRRTREEAGRYRRMIRRCDRSLTWKWRQLAKLRRADRAARRGVS